VLATALPWMRATLTLEHRLAIVSEMRARRVGSYLPENGAL
jgi:hypothetical protein